MTGPRNRFPDRIGISWEDRRPFVGELAAISQFDDRRVDFGVDDSPGPAESDAEAALNFSRGEIWKSWLLPAPRCRWWEGLIDGLFAAAG